MGKRGEWIGVAVLGIAAILGLGAGVAGAEGLKPGDIVVSDAGVDAILAVDPKTGDRRLVSSNGHGEGPRMFLPRGLGYESGGLAVCHAVAQGYTVVDAVHRNYLHGEMVAMGVLAQLVLEGETDEAEKAARFFVQVGLPVKLSDISLSAGDTDTLHAVVHGAMAFPFIGNMPEPVTESALLKAIQAADELGTRIDG